MLVEEAKCYYPLFRLGANVALIASGQYVRQAGLGDAVRTNCCIDDVAKAALRDAATAVNVELYL